MLIKEKLKNPHVDNEFLNSIAESTSQKFSTNFIQKLFQKVKQIDYIMLFESFVEYTADIDKPSISILTAILPRLVIYSN